MAAFHHLIHSIVGVVLVVVAVKMIVALMFFVFYYALVVACLVLVERVLVGFPFVVEIGLPLV